MLKEENINFTHNPPCEGNIKGNIKPREIVFKFNFLRNLVGTGNQPIKCVKRDFIIISKEGLRNHQDKADEQRH